MAKAGLLEFQRHRANVLAQFEHYSVQNPFTNDVVSFCCFHDRRGKRSNVNVVFVDRVNNLFLCPNAKPFANELCQERLPSVPIQLLCHGIKTVTTDAEPTSFIAQDSLPPPHAMDVAFKILPVRKGTGSSDEDDARLTLKHAPSRAIRASSMPSHSMLQ